MRNTILFTLVATLVSWMGISGAAQAAPHGIFPTRQMRELQQLLKPYSAKAGTRTQLLYYGGPVIANAKIYAVFWGPNVDHTTRAQIGDFFAAAVNSTYMDWLKEYNTNIKGVNGHDGTNQQLGRGTFAGNVMITPTHTGATLDDTDIQAELDHQIDIGALPVNDANTLYMIYFPAGITIKIDGQASCSSFCAYHEGFASKSHGNVFYGVMPDQGGMCSWGCGFGSNAFDAMTTVSSHEMIEAITDPFPTPGNTPAFPQAWNTSDGNEIGDLCAGNNTSLTTKGLTYGLQQEFDNATAACAPGPYQNP